MAEPEQEVTITVAPDPCWTSEAEAAAQFWLDLIRRAQQQDGPGDAR